MAVEASTGVIRSYHAHIYFRDGSEREHALQLREWIDQRFSVQLGRVHDVTVGPHTAPMYQVALAPEVFHSFVAWLMLNHAALSVLIHPNTGRARDDHLEHALWLGERLPVRAEVLSNSAPLLPPLLARRSRRDGSRPNATQNSAAPSASCHGQFF